MNHNKEDLSCNDGVNDGRAGDNNNVVVWAHPHSAPKGLSFDEKTRRQNAKKKDELKGTMANLFQIAMEHPDRFDSKTTSSILPVTFSVSC
jgi:hypothetical protein